MGKVESILTIHLEIYAPMVAAAGSLLEVKALALPMVLPLDEDGWTKEYTPRQLLKALGLSRSKAQETKLLAVLESWKATGRIKIQGNRYQFAWVKNPQSGERIPTKKGTESPPVGNPSPENAAGSMNHESYKESINIELIHDMGALLSSVGVGINAHSYAAGWSVEEVKTIIRTAREKRIENTAGYVVNALKARQTPRDEQLEELRKAFENSIGAMTPFILEAIQKARRKYPVSWILEAIQEAKESNGRNWQYVEKILVRWMVQGKKPLPAPEPSYEEIYGSPEARQKLRALQAKMHGWSA